MIFSIFLLNGTLSAVVPTLDTGISTWVPKTDRSGCEIINKVYWCLVYSVYLFMFSSILCFLSCKLLAMSTSSRMI